MPTCQMQVLWHNVYLIDVLHVHIKFSDGVLAFVC